MINIPIIFCFDKNMVISAGVCITSLLLNKHSETFYDFIILYNEQDLTIEYRNKLIILQDKYPNQCRISFFSIGNTFQGAYEIRNITISTYYRLLIPELMPQINSLNQTNYQTIFYLDVDTIIECDLSQVFLSCQAKTEICLFGVCESPTYHQGIDLSYWREIGCNPKSYINAGVLIMNIEALQKYNFTSLCLRHKNKKYTYQDQDIINIVCKDKISFLPLKYNYTSVLYTLALHNKEFQKLKAEEIDNANNGIIHYTGSKPWNSFCLRSEYWWYYYKHSIFKDEQFYSNYHQSIPNQILSDSSYKRIKKIFLKKLISKYFHKTN